MRFMVHAAARWELPNYACKEVATCRSWRPTLCWAKLLSSGKMLTDDNGPYGTARP